MTKILTAKSIRNASAVTTMSGVVILSLFFNKDCLTFMQNYLKQSEIIEKDQENVLLGFILLSLLSITTISFLATLLSHDIIQEHKESESQTNVNYHRLKYQNIKSKAHDRQFRIE